MDFFGIGVQELIVILVLALIFIGPRDMPKLAAQAAQILRQFRTLSASFMTEWKKEIDTLDPDGGLRELKSEFDQTRNILQNTQDEIKSSFHGVEKDLKTSADAVNEVSNGQGLSPKPAPNTIAKTDTAQNTEQIAPPEQSASPELNQVDQADAEASPSSPPSNEETINRE